MGAWTAPDAAARAFDLAAVVAAGEEVGAHDAADGRHLGADAERDRNECVHE